MLEVSNVSHRYGSNRILTDISFNVKPAHLCCITGPSGCGKTTLLRIIAGLENIQAGLVKLNSNTLSDSSHSSPPEKRNIGMVFQNPALFPHLNIFNNIAFGLRGKSKEIINKRVLYLLKLIGLEDFQKKFPHELSGGQQQRISLARALAPEPKLMLLDEPFANLDQSTTNNIRTELLDILKKAMIPILMVTHDPNEVLLTADSMVLLSDSGLLLQSGHPEKVRNKPSSIEVAKFFGNLNLLPAVVQNNFVQSSIGNFPLSLFPNITNDSNKILAIRPEGIRLALDGESHVNATVKCIDRTEFGWSITASLKDKTNIQYFQIHGSPPTTNDNINLALENEHIFLF